MEEAEEKKFVVGRNGGKLYPQKKGEKGHSPNLGRKTNPFKFDIRELAENDATHVLMEGILADAKGNSTNQKVKVYIEMPRVREIVLSHMRLAKKDVQSAKWLSETGYGKPIFTDDDGEEMPFVGFKFIVEDRRKDAE